MKLLVGSVFTSHKKQKNFYDLQIKFLKKTTKDFHHIVFINGKSEYYFKHSETIGNHLDYQTIGLSKSHSLGMDSIIQFFREHPADNYLLLDSDCFPILNNWQEILLSKMHEKKFAAPVRFENLETFRSEEHTSELQSH